MQRYLDAETDRLPLNRVSMRRVQLCWIDMAYTVYQTMYAASSTCPWHLCTSDQLPLLTHNRIAASKHNKDT